MENASQALLIAGGVLLAILTLSMFIFMFGNLNTFGAAEADKKELEQLTAWNAEWEAYNKQLLYGADVLTVVNKAKHNNAEFEESAKYRVDIVIDGKAKSGEVITTSNIAKYKKSVFKCTNVEYSNSTGRINKMVYKLIEELDKIRDYVLENLINDDRIVLYGVPRGTREDKIPLFSFCVKGVHHEDLALILDKMGIAVRSGQMCAEPLMTRYGVTGMLRASFAPYNTFDEAVYFIKCLDKAINMLI